jgi:hypothetical protein
MKQREFLEALYGEAADENLWFVIWSKASMRFVWFQSIEDALTYLKANQEEIYIGCGLFKEPHTGRKGTQDEVWGIRALYADIDVAHNVHSKKNLPPNIPAARTIVEGFGCDPSVIIHSGYGLHCWWLFKEIWKFDSAEERVAAKNLSQRLHLTVLQRANDNGWTVDPVFNLDRVLRLPGTLNCKNNGSVPVKVLFSSDARYNPEDFEEFLVPLEQSAQGTVTITEAERQVTSNLWEGVIFDPNAEPHGMKLFAEIKYNDLFRATWNKQRDPKSFGKTGDDSPSQYHIALAMQAAGSEAQWSNQDIVDLIIAWQRNHHPDKMHKVVHRHKYVRETILKARKFVAQRRQKQTAEEAELHFDTSKDDPPSEQVQKALDYVNSKIGGGRIQKLVRQLMDPPTYTLYTNHGAIKMASAQVLYSRQRFATRVREMQKIVIYAKTKEWIKFTEALDVIMEDRFIDDECLDVDVAFKARMERYIAISGSPTEMDLKDINTFMHSAPFFGSDGHWHIHIEHFKKHLLANKEVDISISNRNLSSLLVELGAKKIKHNISVDGALTSRRTWQLPIDFEVHTDVNPGKGHLTLIKNGSGEE